LGLGGFSEPRFVDGGLHSMTLQASRISLLRNYGRHLPETASKIS
jgi:hypothetical protein